MKIKLNINVVLYVYLNKKKYKYKINIYIQVVDNFMNNQNTEFVGKYLKKKIIINMKISLIFQKKKIMLVINF